MEVLTRFSGLDINYKVVILIIFSVGIFGVITNSENISKYDFVEDYAFLEIVLNTIKIETGDTFVLEHLFSISLELSIVVLAAYLVKRYNKSEIFGKSYIFLGLGFFSVALGKILHLAGVNIEGMPAIDSIFFFGLYIFLFCYLYINIKSFNKGFRSKNVLVISSTAIGLTLFFYAVTSGDALTPFLLHYCGLAVIGSATLASMSLFGFYVLRKQAIGRSWKILSIGLVILAINDIWFHYWDTTSVLADSDPVNFARYASYMIIIYALYIHKKVF